MSLRTRVRGVLAAALLLGLLPWAACRRAVPAPPRLQRLLQQLGPTELLQLEDVTRPVVRLRPGEERRARAELGGAGRLSFAAALLHPPARGFVRLTVRVGGRQVFEDRFAVGRAGHWFRRSVALDGQGPAEVVFRADLVRANGSPLSEPAGEASIALASPRVQPSGPPPRVLVWLSQDALRADHLGTYGYARPTSPAFDSRARSWVVFERAWATSSWTLPSMASQVTSRYPSWHRAVAHDIAADPAVPTVFEVLSANGFTVLGVTANVLVDGPHGLARGFDALQYEERDGSFVNERLLGLLDEWEGGDLALFVHYIDPHHPYAPPAPFDRMFGRVAPPRFHTDFKALQRLRTPDERDTVRALYDGEIAYGDGQIDALLDELSTRAPGPPVVVYSSDHGEELHDHGSWHHGGTLYEEVVHVPFAVSVPGLAGGRVAEPVSMVDLAPTVLDALGIAAPPSFQGRSLLAAARGGRLPPAPVYAETALRPDKLHLLAVRQGDLKLVLARGADGAEQATLFDLATDPGERAPGPATSPEAQRLVQIARAYLARAAAEAPQARPLVVDPRALERLRALGYVE